MHSRLQLSLFAPGIWTICYEPLVSGSFCSLFGVWRNAWFDNGYMFRVYSGFWKYLQFLRDWVDSAPEVDSRNAPIARFPWKSVHYFMSLLYLQLSSQSIFCASRFFGALEHSQV